MLNVATVFSGIGSFEYALKEMNINHRIIFACDNGERILKKDINQINNEIKHLDYYATKKYIDKLYGELKQKNFVYETYKNNYQIEEKDFYQDIRFLDGNIYRNKVDILVGGSPCQSFSICGHYKGLDDAKGTLFFDYARLVREIQPKVFIYENVPGMLSHDGGKTFNIICNIFNSLGYKWRYKIINAKDCGIPQNRKRLFVVGFKNGLNIEKFEFPDAVELDTTMADYLEDKVDKKYYHGEKGFKWSTNKKNIGKRVGINSIISRTQNANQQFNWCGDVIFTPIENCQWAKNDSRVYVGNYNDKQGTLRKMTPRECLRLMGYKDTFKIVVPDRQIYRQCGNSIVVNVLKLICEKIIETGVFKDKL
ncbi:MAG: DNA (cytosine-5-)-methyltransferase [Clostridiales bacterium]|nr:DNA (cytosine-5-)-methyltransferase [Clostridiales bacterium]